MKFTDNSGPVAGMEDLKRWFGWLVLIGPIHMAEQLWFGLDELQELRGMMAAYYDHFRNPDVATVVLVVIVATIVQVLLYAMLVGGRWKLLAAGFFGVSGLIEAHHLVKTLVHGQYFPGFVTAFPFMGIGIMILVAVVREWRRTARPVATTLEAA
jgi:hypothetical protein